MIVPQPATSSSYSLGAHEEKKLWNWLLRRQGLSDDTKLGSALAVAQAALGLHAARLSSPFATVLARGVAPTVALSLFTADSRADLMTIRCMRKTLHTLPLPLAAAAHGATVHFRVRDALRAVGKAGLSARSMARIAASIVRLLTEDGALFHRDIEARLVGNRTTTVAVRLALKLSWEQGVLTYINDARGWNRANRTFALTSVLYPDLDMALSRGSATRQLVREYFDRYGPASLRDAMWWSGLSRSAIVTAMNESENDVIVVHGSWCDAPMYMYRDRFEEFQRARAAEHWSGVNFLAHEDVALKAYFESRRRYLGQLPPRRAFNQIGEVLPTVVQDGHVVGTWAWDAKHRVVRVSMTHGFSSARLRRQVALRARSVTEALRLGYLPTR